MGNKSSKHKQKYGISGKGSSQPSALAPETPFFTPLLSPRHIRLVDLRCTEDQIQTRYSTASLDDAPKFYALSYTWGIPTQRDLELRMQAPSIPVTENLTGAMYFLGTIVPGIYWIDALCINQQDDVEKSSQVALMREIYAAAEIVMVFLGMKSEESTMACNLIGKLCELFQNDTIDLEGAGPQRSPSIARKYPFEDEKLQELGLPLTEAVDWVALADLLSKAYFERMWVLQELVMARGPILAFCGSYQLPFAALQTTLIILLATGWNFEMKQRADERGRHVEMQALDFLPIVTTLMHSQGKRLELQMLLDMSRCLLATDPRDKIFALLGMATEIEAGKEMSISLRPDYSKSVQQVFTEVTGAFIAKGDLSLLSSVEREGVRQVKDLPSWVPDFSATSHNGSFAKGYAAGGGTAVSAVWTPGSNELRVKALVADTVGAVSIHTCGSLHRDNVDPGQFLLEAFVSAARTFGFGASDEFDWLALLAQGKTNIAIDALWQTLVGYGNTLRRTRMVPDMRNHFATFMAKHFVRSLTNKSEELQRRMMAIPNSLELLRMGDADLFVAECLDNLSGNRFFHTEDHQYMGLATQDLEVGDRVMVFAGGSPINIVRKKRNHYQYIGDGYVWGLMDGQALFDKDKHFEKITLR